MNKLLLLKDLTTAGDKLEKIVNSKFIPTSITTTWPTAPNVLLILFKSGITHTFPDAETWLTRLPDTFDKCINWIKEGNNPAVNSWVLKGQQISGTTLIDPLYEWLVDTYNMFLSHKIKLTQ